MRILRVLIPHHHRLDYHHQLNRGIAPEEPKDLGHERVFPRSSSHASQQQQRVVPPRPGIQQNQATQSEDENSATVGPENRVSDHPKSPQDQEDTRRQCPRTPKGKKNTAEKQPSTPKAKKCKFTDSDEDDCTSTTLPVPPLYQGPAASSQGPAASSQGPAASANAGDEDSEYSDEYSAQSQDSGRTVLYSDLHVVIHCEHWAMTPETHKYAAAAGSFCFVTTGNGRQQDIYKFDHFAVPTTIIVP